MNNWKERARQIQDQELSRLSAQATEKRDKEQAVDFRNIGIAAELERFRLEDKLNEVNTQIWSGRGQIEVQEERNSTTNELTGKLVALRATVPDHVYEKKEFVIGRIWGKYSYGGETSGMTGETFGEKWTTGWNDGIIGERVKSIGVVSVDHSFFIKYSTTMHGKEGNLVYLWTGDTPYALPNFKFRPGTTFPFSNYYERPRLQLTLRKDEFDPEYAYEFMDWALAQSSALRISHPLDDAFEKAEADISRLSGRVGLFVPDPNAVTERPKDPTIKERLQRTIGRR